MESKDHKKVKPERVTVTIDYGLCEGCGACAQMYPQLFEIRDEKAWVVDQEQFDAEVYKKDPVICPYRAIIIE